LPGGILVLVAGAIYLFGVGLASPKTK